MARITLRQLLDHAAEQGYGVPAFNINNMEQALAIMAAANEVDAPVIIQASRGARSYANDVMLKHMMDAVTEIYPHRSEEHTSELQSRQYLVCRLLLEEKKADTDVLSRLPC